MDSFRHGAAADIAAVCDVGHICADAVVRSAAPETGPLGLGRAMYAKHSPSARSLSQLFCRRLSRHLFYSAAAAC